MSSSLQPNITSKSNQNFDELKWVIQIRRALEEELEKDDQNEEEIPVCIFNVPQTLMSSDPNSYTPQQLAIGPYHYWRPELYEMERYKLAAAKRTQKQLLIHCLKFETLVEKLVKLEPRIRGCYHKYLDFNGETLAWMMAIDASFLLEFLQNYGVKEEEEGSTKVLTRCSSRMSHLYDVSRRKSGHNTILRDIMMLENQIPILVLRKVLKFLCSSKDVADDMLLNMLLGLCKELSPFKMMDDSSKRQICKDSSHLLDFLYYVIVPKSERSNAWDILEADDQNEDVNKGKGEKDSGGDSSFLKKLLEEVWNLLKNLNKGPILFLKKLLSSKVLGVILKLPWTILSKLPGFAILKQPVEYFFSQNKEDAKPEENGSSINKPPLVDKITIPSVSQLFDSGLRFSPTSGNISTIAYDTKTVTLYLPIVSLDVNTEVILRNLVAYEESNASGPLVFTRYTELMNGIIDTEEDAKLLREKGIIFNRLKSDKEVASMWNGMSKSIKLTKVELLDKVIEDVNKYYNSRWKVKAKKFMKIYVFGSWQFLTLLAAVMLLLLMTLQAFCSVYSCARIFHINIARDVLEDRE